MFGPQRDTAYRAKDSAGVPTGTMELLRPSEGAADGEGCPIEALVTQSEHGSLGLDTAAASVHHEKVNEVGVDVGEEYPAAGVSFDPVSSVFSHSLSPRVTLAAIFTLHIDVNIHVDPLHVL